VVRCRCGERCLCRPALATVRGCTLGGKRRRQQSSESPRHVSRFKVEADHHASRIRSIQCGDQCTCLLYLLRTFACSADSDNSSRKREGLCKLWEECRGERKVPAT
jgi:hypothetical protein